MTNLADRCSHDTFQHWPYTPHYRLGCFAQKGDEGKLQREREREREGKGVYYRWVLWAVDTGQSNDYDSEWWVWHQSSHGGDWRATVSPTVSPLWPRTPHTPNWYLSARSAAPVRPQFVRLITWFAKENLPVSDCHHLHLLHLLLPLPILYHLPS